MPRCAKRRDRLVAGACDKRAQALRSHLLKRRQYVAARGAVGAGAVAPRRRRLRLGALGRGYDSTHCRPRDRVSLGRDAARAARGSVVDAVAGAAGVPRAEGASGILRWLIRRFYRPLPGASFVYSDGDRLVWRSHVEQFVARPPRPGLCSWRRATSGGTTVGHFRAQPIAMIARPSGPGWQATRKKPSGKRVSGA